MSDWPSTASCRRCPFSEDCDGGFIRERFRPFSDDAICLPPAEAMRMWHEHRNAKQSAWRRVRAGRSPDDYEPTETTIQDILERGV